MTAIIDLGRILAELEPRLDTREFVFCTVPAEQTPPWGEAGLFAVIREDEGVTWVLERQSARRLGCPDEDPFRRLSLGVHSSLHAVGLTARVSEALTKGGISANVIAGFYHDHFMVPAPLAETALDILLSLAKPA